MFKQILDSIKAHNRIILIRHANPDYDAFGSQLGLYYSLKNAFPDKEIYTDGDNNSNNLFKIPMDNPSDELYKGSLVILTDQSAINMLTDEKFRLGDELIILDHHESEPDFGDIICIRPEYSSASELVTEFLYESNIVIPKIAADLLYIGIVGDSQRFLFKGTSANTFRMAAILIDSGADIDKDYKLMTRDEDESFKRLKGYVLSNFIVKGKVAYITVPKDVREHYDVSTNGASRGTINLLSGIKGIEAFANFTESDDGTQVYCEFRSKEKGVVEVAKAIGGGGHELACGATVKSFDQVDEIVDMLNKAVEEK